MMLGSFVRLYEDVDTVRREASSTTPEAATPPKSGPSTKAPPIDTTILEHYEGMLHSPDHEDATTLTGQYPDLTRTKKTYRK